MATPILTTKLYIPAPREKMIHRAHLVARLNETLPQRHSALPTQGFRQRLTLVSAPAGFGKTTLVSEWVADCGRPVAWLSLDQGDNDLQRFLIYLIAAFQTMAAGEPHGGKIGAGVLPALQSPRQPPAESILTALLNDIASFPTPFILVLDDYYVIDNQQIDDALAFLLEHLPPQLNMVIATREDPRLPLARLRARGQLIELRAAELRFNLSETAGFLNQVMGLNLADPDIAALEARTEGWIAGLQLAALALQGLPAMPGDRDVTGFIQSFSGSHHFVMDYLMAEVLQLQPENIQNFLLRTAILDRFCGALCDAVRAAGTAEADGQKTLNYLQQANLFIVPLDNERRWYRYHHLFAELLRQRLQQRVNQAGVAEIHIRASEWFENNDLELDAFHHAVAANDLERAERLMEGRGMPLHFRGAVIPVLNWLGSLPQAVLNARPSLLVTYASVLSMAGQTAGVAEKLQAAETALQGAAVNAKTRNLIGHIAAIRALLAATQNQIETIISQSRRALEYLDPGNLPVRTATIWKMGIAYQFQGERAAAGQAYTEAISISRATGNTVINLSATIGLGNIRESQNQLQAAVETYQNVLGQMGEAVQPAGCEAYLGLARIGYQRNDLDAAERHALQSLQMARQLFCIDRTAACEVLLARLKFARRDIAGAKTDLIHAGQIAAQNHLVFLLPEVIAAQVRLLLHQDQLAAAERLAQRHELPISQARVLLAQDNSTAALKALEPVWQQADAKDWEDEKLKIMILQALAFHRHGATDKALQLLGDAMSLAEPEGIIRIFVDEGVPMIKLLTEAVARGIMPDYTGKTLAIMRGGEQITPNKSTVPGVALPPERLLDEPLSPRELKVLQLIARGLSNREISAQLFLALDTVKGHNRRIFDKLQVQRRTEAVARARELGLL